MIERLLLVFLIACGGGSDPECMPSPDPTGANCAVFRCDLPPMDLGWLSAQIEQGTCGTSPPLVPDDTSLVARSAYASCIEESASPAQCVLDPAMQFCQAGYWTKLCQHDSDCPSTMRCMWGNGVGDVPPEVSPRFGACMQACSVAGSSQCGRCDLSCTLSLGVCTKYVTPPDAGPALDAQ